MTNPVVNVAVSISVAAPPSKLQKSGAFVSQGGTNTSPGTKSLLTQLSSLTPLLNGAKAITSATYSGGTGLVTITTTSPHGLTINDTIPLTIAGLIGSLIASGYNGTFLCTVTGASTFTYAVPSAPGTSSGSGVYTEEDVAELLAMATSFFAQGGQQAVTVLECGPGNATDGVGFLNAWITANPGVFYSYLVPRYWDGNPAFLAMLASFEATTSKTYFFVTTSLATWTLYTSLMKCVIAMVEAPAYGVWAANALSAISYSGAWAANVLTALTWSASGGGTANATTTTAHGVQPGQFFTLSGSTPAGWNGTFLALPGTTGSTLVWSSPTNPGTETGFGTLVASTFGTVTASTTTNHGVLPGEWFSIAGCIPAGYNGTFQALPGTTGSTLIYAVPAAIGAESTLGTLVQSQYSSAGIPSTEFSLASEFFVTLNYAPSSTNKVTPLNFAFVSGVTPFPAQGNSALITQLLAAGINLVGTGSQANISNTLILGGTTMDGNPFKYWYSIDWAQINLQINVTAALIDGANNPQNPLDYNQDGINILQQTAISTMKTGIADALVLNPIQPLTLNAAAFQQALVADTYSGYTLVNADPFGSYVTENPNDYAAGVYNGLSVDYTPLRGFDSIRINVQVSQFAA
jgi:hypothetical protein